MEEVQTLHTVVSTCRYPVVNVALQLSVAPSLEGGRLDAVNVDWAVASRLSRIRERVLLGVVVVDGYDLMPDGVDIAGQDCDIGIPSEDTARTLHTNREIADLIGRSD